MKRLIVAVCSVVALLAPNPALAWGAQGHQYVGALAAHLLNNRAAQQVRKLLGPGVDLAHASVWPDCIRDVRGSSANGFSYVPGQFTPQGCQVFGQSAAAKSAMTDYARRNWTNCEYSGKPFECHKAYHFADINVHNRDHYDAAFFGAADHDVVHAIRAAIAILSCKQGQSCAAPSPFDIAQKREALMLLAHFVGDAHQPLHVGAIYVDANNVAGGDDGRSVVGGNWLLLKPGDTGGNLHHEWDTITASVAAGPSKAAVKSACLIAPRPDPVLQDPDMWATESVEEAATAYQGFTMAPDPAPDLVGRFDLTFVNRQGYASALRAAQARRLIAAGARLAATLNALWPSTKPLKDCA